MCIVTYHLDTDILYCQGLLGTSDTRKIKREYMEREKNILFGRMCCLLHMIDALYPNSTCKIAEMNNSLILFFCPASTSGSSVNSQDCEKQLKVQSTAWGWAIVI